MTWGRGAARRRLAHDRWGRARAPASAARVEPGEAFRQQRKQARRIDIADKEGICLTPGHAPPVGHGHPGGEFALRLDLDIDPAPRKQIRCDQIGNRAGIMQRGAILPVFFPVIPLVEGGPPRNGGPDRAAVRRGVSASQVLGAAPSGTVRRPGVHGTEVFSPAASGHGGDDERGGDDVTDTAWVEGDVS